MSKLFVWSINHLIKRHDGLMINRNERGIVRAKDQKEATEILQKTVCTAYSKDLTVVEIPDKMSVYSIGHEDSIVSE